MRTFVLYGVALFLALTTSMAGTESYSKNIKEVATAPAPCPPWYRDREWNVSLWGTYAFPGNDAERIEEEGMLMFSTIEGDRYLESDDAWGGGIDLKYFFHRYFGVGLEGFVLSSRRQYANVDGFLGFDSRTSYDERLVGGLLGTFTLRYPIGCSRFAPYLFVGGGAIFGGGERTVLEFPAFLEVETRSTDSETELVGQFGGGLEMRVTERIGLISDFSWNVIDGPDDNFGMVRAGLNFAF